MIFSKANRADDFLSIIEIYDRLYIFKNSPEPEVCVVRSGIPGIWQSSDRKESEQYDINILIFNIFAY